MLPSIVKWGNDIKTCFLIRRCVVIGAFRFGFFGRAGNSIANPDNPYVRWKILISFKLLRCIFNTKQITAELELSAC